MAIYLHDKYADKIGKKFVESSIVKGRFSNEYSFSGVRTVKITTPVTVPLVDYKRNGTNRYGTPVEMQDTVQELTLSQDKAFAITVDKGNNMDQHGLKAAGKMLSLQIEQQCVPYIDKYALAAIASKAGTIVSNSTALSKSNIVDRIVAGANAMDDAEIPADGRTLFVPAKVATFLMLSDEFIGVDKLAEKSLTKGKIGEFFGMSVVKVPAGRWPENLNFLIAYKNSAMIAEKLNDTKLHQDPPGISGNLLEGRLYFDAFVFEPSSAGVYAEIDGAKAEQVATPVIGADGAITCATSGATIYYTTDGSDPRYSAHAKVGSASDITADGTVVKAYAVMSGKWPSAVASTTLTA